MKRTSRLAAALALGFVACAAGDASAAWNNVFQTTCCGGRSSSSSFFAPPAPACAPQVSYVQRCYYQPVTSYKTETYYDPVTTYKTSYYWEPCTRMRYTSYYDPCTGCTQNVAKPVTSYSLKSKCNAVQSYVQRCRMVPVTEYRRSYYMEPVICQAACDPCAGGNCNTPGAPPAAGVTENPGGPSPGAGQSNEPPRIPAAGIQGSANKPAAVPPPSAKFRPDRVASFNNESGRLQGSVVRDDRITPRPNATLSFKTDAGKEVKAQTDFNGRFLVELPAGEYTLSVPGTDGKPVYHSTVNVKNADNRLVMVVSR